MAVLSRLMAWIDIITGLYAGNAILGALLKKRELEKVLILISLCGTVQLPRLQIRDKTR